MRIGTGRLLALATCVLATTGCPEDKPIDFSKGRTTTAPSPAAPSARKTMPAGELPLTLPRARSTVPTLAYAPELLIYDREKFIRRATTGPNPYAGAPEPYRSTATTTIGVTGQLDDAAGTLALFLASNGSATEALYVLDDLELERIAAAVEAGGSRGQLPYTFGSSAVAVRDRFQLDLRGDEVTLGTQAMSGAEIEARLPALIAELRSRSSVGLEARIGVGSGTTVAQLFSLLELLAIAKVESVYLFVVSDSVAHSTTGLRARGSAIPTVSIGQPNVQGDLDKAIIRRYIKRNIAKIQYCYEKQLLVSRGLAGVLQVQFFVAPTGLVSSSSGSGVSPEVASCVASVIEAIEFPKPQNGGGVQVNYPFTFRASGG